MKKLRIERINNISDLVKAHKIYQDETKFDKAYRNIRNEIKQGNWLFNWNENRAIRETTNFLNKWKCRISKKSVTSSINAISEKIDILQKLSYLELETDSINEQQEIISNIYEYLSSRKGVGATSTSKILHILIPKLFPMWDTYMREAFKVSSLLSTKEYFEYMKQISEMIKDMGDRLIKKVLNETGLESVLKLIDEYYFVKYSMLITKILESKKQKLWKLNLTDLENLKK